MSGLSGSGLLLNVVLIASKPWVIFMFVYRLSISMVKRCVWGGTCMELILVRKCVVSLR